MLFIVGNEASTIRRKERRNAFEKKQRIVEYTEWGRCVASARKPESGFDEFLDAFVEEAIESNGCFCGGGGKGKRMEHFVELGQGLDDTESLRVTLNVDSE